MLFVLAYWCLSVLIVPSQCAKRDSLWLLQKPGDIILHGLYPIHKQNDGLNIEAIAWMGAMIHRIEQVNQEKLLPGNLTLGYVIRDTGNDVQTGLRQTLSLLNDVLYKETENQTQIPVVLGPAFDELERKSAYLYKLFDVPRISYTTTSYSFSNNEKMIRTVPSDFIHTEALFRLLNELKILQFSAVISNSSPWKERWNIFEIALKETKSRMEVKNIVYVKEDEINVSSTLRGIQSDVVIIFAESNISSLIRKGKILGKRIWIEMCQFDDPLLREFDTFGKLKKKIIIRNVRSNGVDQYRADLAKKLFSNQRVIEPNWLRSVYEEFCSHNESGSNHHKCIGFRERIITSIGRQNEFNSSLTLQGILDATNLVITALVDTLKQCTRFEHCLKLSGTALLEKLQQIKFSNDDFDTRYSMELLDRVTDSAMLGRRMKVKRGWTFQKIREWRVTGSELRDKLRLFWHNDSRSKTFISIPDQTNSLPNLSNNTTCERCLRNQSICAADNAVMNWRDTWAIAIYFLESVSLLAVLSAFIYFLQHKNSPIMILCYSWPDNIILAVLCLFSVLPMMHIGEMTSHRCKMLWPVVNIAFAFYAALLLTKTLFVQNLLKCEVATERPVRRMSFAVLAAFIQAVILASFFIFDSPRTTHLACTYRGTVVLCNIEKNAVMLASITFNWLLLCALFAFSVVETLRQRQNFCRTENLVVVATLAWLSYTCLSVLAYFNIHIKLYLATTLVQCIIYLANSTACLGFIYVPTLRLVSTWLRQHTRQQKNLTSIKHAQVMSSKRQSAGPIRDSVFGGNFDHLTIPSTRHSGYYFDLRPASAVTDMSYPTSLVRSVHEHTHVVFGYGRRGPMSSVNGATSVESVPSVDWLEAPSLAHSANSSYDNLSRAGEDTAAELTPQELLHEISTYWERQRSSDVIANEVHEDNVETNKWPSLEKLRTSNL